MQSGFLYQEIASLELETRIIHVFLELHLLLLQFSLLEYSFFFLLSFAIMANNTNQGT